MGDVIDSRAKGARGEREVCRILQRNGWPNAERTSDGRSQEGRGDIAHGPQGVHIDSKLRERLNVTAAWDRVKQDACGLDIPVLVHRPSRHEWLATLEFSELLALLKLREMGP